MKYKRIIIRTLVFVNCEFHTHQPEEDALLAAAECRFFIVEKSVVMVYNKLL